MGNRRTPRGPGRPRKLLDPIITDTLLAALKQGVPISIACQGASISESGFYHWMQRGHAEAEAIAEAIESGEDPEPDPNEAPFLELYRKVTKARADAALRNVNVIQRVAQGGTVIEESTKTYMENGQLVTEKTTKKQAPDWRAAAWYLERSHRSEFAKAAEQVELSGPGGGAIQLSSAEAESLAARLAVSARAAIEAAKEPDGETGEDDIWDAEEVTEAAS